MSQLKSENGTFEAAPERSWFIITNVSESQYTKIGVVNGGVVSFYAQSVLSPEQLIELANFITKLKGQNE